MTIRFRCKDFLLKDCEFEIKGAHSADEVMKLVDVHVTEAHRTVKVLQRHGRRFVARRETSRPKDKVQRFKVGYKLECLEYLLG